MQDLERALAEIGAIRDQLAKAAQFRGFGPTTFALTSLIVGSAAAAQARWIPSPETAVDGYLLLWLGVAALSCALIGFEMVIRVRRIYSRLANEMLRAAVEQFLPAGLAGGLLTLVLWRFAPESLWMLPGLWQLAFGLGVFASARFLPNAMWLVGAWYFTTGLACLAVFHGPGAFAPIAMGLPFGVGQLLVAGVLVWDQRGHE
ncbi:MAG: hypothetical protein JO127_15150 [Caulobacteraceae bacterium]|nr:hypothetical protein [Caulobacteraceae bacterium]